MALLFVIMLAACENDEQLPFKTANSLPAVSTVMVSHGKIVNFQTRASNTMGQVALRFKDSESLRSYRQSLENKTEGEKIKSVEAPVFLIINKMDTVKGPEILKVIDTWKDVLPFKEIIPVSALKEEGLTDLLGSIYRYLPEGAYFYGEDEVTDEPIKQLAAELIREVIPSIE